MGGGSCQPLATQSATRFATVANWREASHSLEEVVDRARRHEAARPTGGAATTSAM